MNAPRLPEAPERAAGISRKALLRQAGLGIGMVLVVGSGAIGYRAYDQGVLEVGDGAAYEPWSNWSEHAGLLPLVGAAILAPSPHNAQAWLFRVGPDRIDLFTDSARGTGATDPVKREMYVGLGAALENLGLAAQAAGYAADVELLPEGPSSTHAARVQLGRAATRRSPLYEAIPMRHTNRYPYVEGKELPPAALVTMAALAGPAMPNAHLFWFTSSAERGRIGEHLVAATEALVADPDQSGSDFRVVPAGLGRDPAPARRDHRRCGRALRPDRLPRETLTRAVARGDRRVVADRDPRSADEDRRCLRNRRCPRRLREPPAARGRAPARRPVEAVLVA